MSTLLKLELPPRMKIEVVPPRAPVCDERMPGTRRVPRARRSCRGRRASSRRAPSPARRSARAARRSPPPSPRRLSSGPSGNDTSTLVCAPAATNIWLVVRTWKPSAWPESGSGPQPTRRTQSHLGRRSGFSRDLALAQKRDARRRLARRADRRRCPRSTQAASGRHSRAHRRERGAERDRHRKDQCGDRHRSMTLPSAGESGGPTAARGVQSEETASRRTVPVHISVSPQKVDRRTSG